MHVLAEILAAGYQELADGMYSYLTHERLKRRLNNKYHDTHDWDGSFLP